MTEELLIKYSQTFRKYLIDQGMIEEWAMLLNVVFNSILVIIVLYVVNAIFRSFLIKAFKAFTIRTKTSFDDHLVATEFPRYFTRLIPIGILWRLIPILFQNLPTLAYLSLLALKVYLVRSEEHTSELQSRPHLVCRLLLEKKNRSAYS